MPSTRAPAHQGPRRRRRAVATRAFGLLLAVAHLGASQAPESSTIEHVEVASAGSISAAQVSASASVSASLATTAELSSLCSSDAPNWVSPSFAAEGYHVLCVSGDQAAGYKDGVLSNAVSVFSLPVGWAALRAELETRFSMDNVDAKTPTWKKQPWTAFNVRGQVLDSAESVRGESLVLLFEGGQWIWPGISIGFRRTLSHLDHPVVLETLETQPLVFRIDGFLEDDECDYIIEQAQARLAPSSVSRMDKDKDADSDTEWRTSWQTWLRPGGSDGKIATIDARVEGLTHVAASHQEAVQVLRYRYKERYDHHTDYFDPKFYTDHATIENGHRNRMITVFWYMSNVDKGGETGFPRAGGLPSPTTMRGCSQGLKVKPRKGDVIMFYSLKPSGALDEFSLHGGCPVEDEINVKWAANKWVWNKPTRF